MTLFNYINTNLDRIRYDITIGLIAPSTLHYFQIYSRFDYYHKLGHSFRDAVLCTSLDYEVTERWICMIIKRMEQTV
jgi:hypothetical protein